MDGVAPVPVRNPTGPEFDSGLFGIRPALKTPIHEADQMFTFIAEASANDEIARAEYLKSGALIMQVVNQLIRWKFGSFDNVIAFLDFASGFGRLTRFLVQELPAERIWIAEIQPEAVAFQQAQFGVHGLLTTTNPADLQCDQRFDCIFVASLFSHLPEASFTPWLTALYKLLTPDGLLVFSVHDETWLDPAIPMPASGIWFEPVSEIATLDADQYGKSIVTETFVRTAIAQASDGRAAYRRIKRGLHYHQDLYLVTSQADPDFAGLQFTYGPAGTVDQWRWSEPDELWLRGWAVDLTPGSAIEEVQVWLNGQLVQKCLPHRRRPDINKYLRDERFIDAGWECSCSLPNPAATDQLVVMARSTGGVERPLFVSPVSALLPSANDESLPATGTPMEPERLRRHEQIVHLKAELETQLSYIYRLEAALEDKNAALRDLENRVRQLEAELISARTPRLPWKRLLRKR
jgi:2-polyprenyl-3-methyl-5-hydroxy-6-metoxy-1,4-benzoquinol methylase